MNVITSAFSACIAWCYSLTHNYVLAIALFTVFTKVILLPVSLWTQRNGIKMVELTPEINRLKIDYYGDKAVIAEKTQELYKKGHYHPLAGMIPLVIQIFLLAGVTGAIRQLLVGTDNIFSAFPSQRGGLTLLMPVGAGLAATALGLAQNHLNPLQREQSAREKFSTNALSVAISFFLGAFVPVGVGFYWIFSNLFSIVQQLVLNAIISPKKYVDYEALAASQKELAALNSLGPKVSIEDKRREKADYKRFFHVVNKHLVFYSEANGFYKYFQDLMDYLLAHSNVVIHYITSDPKDHIFELAKTQPQIRPYYIGQKRLITLMMKMDADIVVMTTPDLENFYIKRSYVRKDIEYIYVPHGFGSDNTELRTGALNHFDTIYVNDKQSVEEIRATERVYDLPAKRLVEFGNPLMDRMLREYQAMEKPENSAGPKRVLIAPSWQVDNILDLCLDEVLGGLLNKGYHLVVRPHPQYVRLFPTKLAAMQQKYSKYADQVEFETDFTSTSSVYSADLLMTDWSGVGFEYAFTTCKPVLFIHTPMKIMNPEWEKIGMVSIAERLRGEVGYDLQLDELGQIGEVVDRLLSQGEEYREKIDRISHEERFNFGHSAEVGGRDILARLRERAHPAAGSQKG